jgi:hypothetical protein
MLLPTSHSIVVANLRFAGADILKRRKMQQGESWLVYQEAVNESAAPSFNGKPQATVLVH